MACVRHAAPACGFYMRQLFSVDRASALYGLDGGLVVATTLLNEKWCRERRALLLRVAGTSWLRTENLN